ncbi:MAG: hypothetical protein LBU39_02220 [Desulfobulbaceae bacterium]|jgi:hypothetical protein|nr:hypothetical protein [Desulfobulbaceae bacterium]
MSRDQQGKIMVMKERVMTFKASGRLAEMLERLPNKSEFIRHAVEAALAGACPLCGGSGLLSEEQRRHLRRFLEHHPLEKCDECQAVHFVCQHQSEDANRSEALREEL